jgi:hypothetical protein
MCCVSIIYSLSTNPSMRAQLSSTSSRLPCSPTLYSSLSQAPLKCIPHAHATSVAPLAFQAFACTSMLKFTGLFPTTLPASSTGLGSTFPIRAPPLPLFPSLSAHTSPVLIAMPPSSAPPPNSLAAYYTSPSSPTPSSLPTTISGATPPPPPACSPPTPHPSKQPLSASHTLRGSHRTYTHVMM